LRTADAVTTARGIEVSLIAVTILYLVLGIATIAVLRALSRRWGSEAVSESNLPYGPNPR
jgi:cytochrome d ubiquinol oxidase subunit I